MADNSTSDHKTIAVIGANGRLGRTIAAAFAAAGWQVNAITRSGKPVADLAPGSDIRHRAADAFNADALTKASGGCAFIFNALNPPYTRWRTDALPMARNVIAAAGKNGAVHLFPGNVYNFGTTIAEHPREDSAMSGDHPKAAIRISMEDMFRQAAETDGVRTLIVRAGDFFGGTGTGSWFDLVIASKAAKGVFTYPGPLDRIHAWAYLPDLAQAFVRLAEKADNLGVFEKFHFEGHNVTGAQLQRAMEQSLGRSLKRASLPWPILRIGGMFVPMWRETAQMAYLWDRPHRLSGEKLEAIIGPLPHTPLEQAVSQALRDLDIESAAPRARAYSMPTLAA